MNTLEEIENDFRRKVRERFGINAFSEDVMEFFESLITQYAESEKGKQAQEIFSDLAINVMYADELQKELSLFMNRLTEKYLTQTGGRENK